jgi:hypothetical protein
VKDSNYPAKLATRLLDLMERKIPFQPSARNMRLARAQFDYSVLAGRIERVIERTLCKAFIDDPSSAAQTRDRTLNPETQ